MDPPGMYYNICVISGTSGSGKSTLINKLFAEYKNKFAFSVSHTTRSPRGGEVNGREYHFVSREVFSKLLKEGSMLEHTQFAGNFYGTAFDSLKECCHKNSKVCILDLDVEGVKQIKTSDLNAFYVFIMTPTIDHLAKRLKDRGTETLEGIEKRLAEAKTAIKYAESNDKPYDCVIINDDLNEAYAKLKQAMVKRFGSALQ